ncbi:hypothetical protein C8Q74DRAFT_1364725 [Fomes fomentarius]|nr:hypothetical protein C8Q74DRAFT_1364725 [Fomes fomentarius]
MDVKTRPELPIELYTHILKSLPPGDASTVKTLLSFFAVNTVLRTVASASIVWKPVYEAQYTQCVPENEARRRAELGNSNFYKLFRRRHEIDRRALALVDEIRLNVEGRSARARVLAREYSFDVWDALRVESVLPLPKYFRRPPQDKAEDIEPAPHAFPRRYWARAVQGVIARYWAVVMWKRAVAGDQKVTFEELLMGFSAFFGWSPQLLAKMLDHAAESCRSRLVTDNVLLNQMDAKFDVRKVCEGIFEGMKEEGLIFGPDEQDRGDNLLSIYPHILLTEEIVFNTSDLAKVWYFTAMARRLGLDMYPTLENPTSAGGQPVCCIRSKTSDDVPTLVKFSPVPSVVPVTETNAYRRMLRAGLARFSESERAYLPKMIANACLPPVDLSLFLTIALTEAGHGLHLYQANPGMEPELWMHREQDREMLATHALQCLFAISQRTEAVLITSTMAEKLPFDGQVVLLDVLLADAQPGSNAAMLAREVRQLVESSENLDRLVMRRSRYPTRPDIPYVGRVVAWPDFDSDQGFILDWKIKVEDTGPDAGKTVVWERVAYPGNNEQTRNPEPPSREYYRYTGLTKHSARLLYLRWEQFGRYVEDVSFAEVDEEGNPKRLVLTEEMRTLYPEDGIADLAPYPA